VLTVSACYATDPVLFARRAALRRRDPDISALWNKS
jgi:hypothetical protein